MGVIHRDTYFIILVQWVVIFSLVQISLPACLSTCLPAETRIIILVQWVVQPVCLPAHLSVYMSVSLFD